MNNNFGTELLEAFGISSRNVISIDFDKMSSKSPFPILTVKFMVTPSNIDKDKLDTVLKKYKLVPINDTLENQN